MRFSKTQSLTTLFLTVVVVTGLLATGQNSSSSAEQPKKSFEMVFSHIGVVTTKKNPNERFVEATRVWVTDFQNHPFHVEWLRFEADSPVHGPVREMPHVAYEVDNIAEASQGMKELLAPFEAGIAVVGFYQSIDGAVIEFMEMK